MSSKLIVNAYGKLNLFLDITGRRDDGYHDIVSVMQRIDLSDKIILSKTHEGIQLTCNDKTIPTDETNTAYRAVRLFFKETGVFGGVSVDIEKNIPQGGGLGGSSADAAEVLVGMNTLFQTGYTVEQLCEMGKQIGADVPFCIRGGTALCEGIGEIITPLPFLADCWFVVVQPDFPLYTKAAYEKYDQAVKPYDPTSPSQIIKGIEQNNKNEIAKSLYNIFQLLYDDPRINKICTVLRDLGALGSGMTGSGSCVFGIFENEESAKIAIRNMPFHTKFVCTSKE